MLTGLKNNRKRTLLRSRSFLLLVTVLLAVLVVGSTLLTLVLSKREGQARNLTSSVNKGTATQKPTNTPTPKVIPSFVFTAAGDYAQTTYTTANLNNIAKSKAAFNLGLGDFNYDPRHITSDQWSTYVKSHLPANFPFEILDGNEDRLQFNAFITELPNHIKNISGSYGIEYYFDYPPDEPLARFIMVSPGSVVNGTGYNYIKGDAHYNWVSNTIDSARAAHIPWVIVGMHEYCIVIGSNPCVGQDLLNLLLSKHVDLILQAHKHNYQVSKQLALNSTTCKSLLANSYTPGCVVNTSTSLMQGKGSVIVITGTGGETPLATIDTRDPELGYFRKWEGANLTPTWGISQFIVSPTQITMKFVAAPGGSFTDSFTISG